MLTNYFLSIVFEFPVFMGVKLVPTTTDSSLTLPFHKRIES